MVRWPRPWTTFLMQQQACTTEGLDRSEGHALFGRRLAPLVLGFEAHGVAGIWLLGVGLLGSGYLATVNCLVRTFRPLDPVQVEMDDSPDEHMLFVGKSRMLKEGASSTDSTLWIAHQLKAYLEVLLHEIMISPVPAALAGRAGEAGGLLC